MGASLMTPSMRLAVGLVAAIVAGAWLGLAYDWFLWSDVPEENRPAFAAARGAVWYAVAFGISEVVRRLLRAGWFFLVPVTVLVGALILAASVMNFVVLPHPTWFIVATLVGVPLSAWLTGRTARRWAPA
jgi:hypothetical protein